MPKDCLPNRPRREDATWGRPRSEMVGAGAIVARMADDLARLVGDRGCDAVIDETEMRRAGWTQAQIAEHGLDAVATLREAAERANSHRRRAA